MTKNNENKNNENENENENVINGFQFVIENVPVGELEVDPEVQRDKLDYNKVEKIKREFNPGALGTISVSRRNRGKGASNIIIDGWHRWQVVKELTDNQGRMLCRVFEDLTPEEEAMLFLDLNYGNQPNLLDKFRMKLRAKVESAVVINNVARRYGWIVAPGSNAGSIQAVGALEQILHKSINEEHDPELLDMTLRCISRVWGNTDREATNGAILKGVASVLAEYGSQLDFDRLVQRLKSYESGAWGLLNDSRSLSNSKKLALPMAVADNIVDHYNKGLKTGGKSMLSVWSRRRF